MPKCHYCNKKLKGGEWVLKKVEHGRTRYVCKDIQACSVRERMNKLSAEEVAKKVAPYKALDNRKVENIKHEEKELLERTLMKDEPVQFEPVDMKQHYLIIGVCVLVFLMFAFIIYKEVP